MLRGRHALLMPLFLFALLGVARADDCALLPDLAPCDDGLFCDGLDFCMGGACVSHLGDPCLLAVPCASTCDETQKLCADPAGTPCADDGNPCTSDVCDG